MDSSTNIIALSLLLFFTIPFIYMSFNAQKKKKGTFASLLQLANQHHCKINKHEIKDDFIVALDTTHHHAFFYKKGIDINTETVVNLEEYEDCKVVKKYDGSQKKIEHLELSFFPKNKSKSVITFDLYDININKQLTGEIQLAEKWSSVFNDQIKNNK